MNPNPPKVLEPIAPPPHPVVPHVNVLDMPHATEPHPLPPLVPLHPLPLKPVAPVPEPVKVFAPQVGDVLTLKSGGPAMVVTALSVPGEVAGVTVQYFNWLDNAVHSAKFALTSVMEADDKTTWKPFPVK